jgi:hypothetical protein
MTKLNRKTQETAPRWFALLQAAAKSGQETNCSPDFQKGGH